MYEISHFIKGSTNTANLMVSDNSCYRFQEPTHEDTVNIQPIA